MPKKFLSDFRYTPDPPDYASALTEIGRLQAQLQRTNEKWQAAFAKAEEIRRSAAGNARAMQKEIDQLRAELAAIKSQEASNG